MSERPEPPPEARLIAAALKRARMSVRKAASTANMSEGRWRQIMNGYQTVSAGVHIPVTGPGETVARMALVAGVRPDQLADAGREDAAEELRALTPDAEKTTAELLAEGHAAMDVIEAELDRRIRRMWQVSDRQQLEELLRTLRALQDK